jgi:hypothetical protein
MKMSGLFRALADLAAVRLDFGLPDNTLGAHGVASSSNGTRPAHRLYWC